MSEKQQVELGSIMTESNILSVIAIVASRLKRSSDSLEVFRSVLNLSITSRTSKNYLNDKLLVELNYRYVRDRTRFVIKKLEYFIINNNFDKFKQFADVVMDQFSRLEGARLLNYRLLYITEHASDTFLSSYLDYLHENPHQVFTKRKALQPESTTLLVYSNIRRLFIKAMQIMCKALREDKVLLLFRHLLHRWNRNESDFATVIEDISSQKHLNFGIVDYYMKQFDNGKILAPHIDPRWMHSLLTLKDRQERIIGAINVTKYRVQLPIQEQPWFFGSISKEDIDRFLKRWPINACCLTVFVGSRLYSCQTTRRRLIQNEHATKGLAQYAVPNEGVIKDFELYQFYRALVKHDLEGLKSLQATHNFNWIRISERSRQLDNDAALVTGTQPHPLSEYLNVVDDIREEVVEWLFELCPLERIVFKWERHDIPDSHINIIQKIIERGSSISSNLWIQYVTKVLPTKRAEMKLLANAWDDVDGHKVWQYLFECFNELCKQQRVISEAKMTILLAWKYATGESIGFRNLPKELIQLIVSFVDDHLTVRVFADILADPSNQTQDKCSDWINSLLVRNITFKDNSTFRKMKASILKLIDRCSDPLRSIGEPFMKFIFKYETDHGTLSSLWHKYTHNNYSSYTPYILQTTKKFIIESLKTKNRAALKVLLTQKQADTALPTKGQFEEKIKPKHNLTYEDALKLIEEVQKEVKSS